MSTPAGYCEYSRRYHRFRQWCRRVLQSRLFRTVVTCCIIGNTVRRRSPSAAARAPPERSALRRRLWQVLLASFAFDQGTFEANYQDRFLELCTAGRAALSRAAAASQ